LHSTLRRVTISNASDLYGYEINFSIDSGSVGSVASSNFLGATSEATYRSNQKNDYLYVYGSRLDSAKAGKTGPMCKLIN